MNNIIAKSFFLILLISLQNSYASQSNDKGLTKKYLKCLFNKGVNPPDIPDRDNEYCLVQAGIQDPGEDARKKAASKWHNCLLTQAAALDDGVSPVEEIAKTIITTCPSQWRNFIATMWVTPAAKSKMANGLKKYAINDGRIAVLKVRKVKNN